MVKDSILIRVDRVPPKPIKPKSLQDDVKEGKHYTFSGEIKCDDCSSQLMLRVVPFMGPDDQKFDHTLITHKKVKTGDFKILVPKSDKPVVLELLIDSNENEAPSGGRIFCRR